MTRRGLFYTGLQTYEDFIFLLATLGNTAYELNCLYCRCGQISVENQLFLTLTKIRQHKTNFELSRLSNISETAVVNIRVTWVNCIFIDNSNTHICITYFLYMELLRYVRLLIIINKKEKEIRRS